MPFRMRLKLYSSWCLLLLLSCSTSPYDLSLYNLTGEYVVRLADGEKITNIKQVKADGSVSDDAWTTEDLKQIFAHVQIMGKISPTETLLIADAGYRDSTVSEANCGVDCAKGQSWIYNEKNNTLERVRKVNAASANLNPSSYVDNPDDIELASEHYYIKAYSADAGADNKNGSKYYWVGKDNVYWVQSSRKPHNKTVIAAHQCSDDKTKSDREIAVKYSIRVQEENNAGYWKRRNLNECFYADKRKPKILYLNTDSLITYTKNSVIYFNDDYPKGMIIPPNAGDDNEFITDFFNDADGIQAGLGERDSFWVKKSNSALMFHKSSDEDDEHVVFNYTKFELGITADKMAMWVDRRQDGDADSKVLIDSKIIYIEGGELTAAEVRKIDKAYSKIEDEDSEDDEDEDEE